MLKGSGREEHLKIILKEDDDKTVSPCCGPRWCSSLTVFVSCLNSLSEKCSTSRGRNTYTKVQKVNPISKHRGLPRMLRQTSYVQKAQKAEPLRRLILRTYMNGKLKSPAQAGGNGLDGHGHGCCRCTSKAHVHCAPHTNLKVCLVGVVWDSL